MTDKVWKAFERRVSKFFGGTRNALSGRNSKAGSSGDVLHRHLYIECKQRKRHSVVSLWDKCKVEADKEDKFPVVCLSEKGRKGFWVVCHSGDLCLIAAMRKGAEQDERKKD